MKCIGLLILIAEYYLGGDPGPRGGGQLQKIWDFRGIKLQIFGAEGAENLKKEFFKENLTVFLSFI